MDPISTAASIITLFGAAGATFRAIHDLINDISEAHQEIKAQCQIIGSFCLTLTNLLQFCANLPDEFPLDLDLCGVQEFISKAENMEAQLKAKLENAKGNRARKFRESCKWLLFDRSLDRFMRSLSRWNDVLTQALLITQIKLSKHTSEQISSLVALPQCRIESHGTSVQQADLPYSINFPHRTANIESTPPSRIPLKIIKCLSGISEPVGTLSDHIFRFQVPFIEFSIRGGRIIIKQWSKQGEGLYITLPQSKGCSYSISLISRVLWFATRWRLIAHLSAYRITQQSAALNFRITLDFGRIIPFDSPAISAIKRGDVPFLQQQLSLGHLSLSDRTPRGYSPLHFAASYGNPEMIRFLIIAGFSPDIRNDHGESALHVAVQSSKSYECARLLIDNGADLLQQDMIGRTPLHHYFNDVICTIMTRYSEDLDTWMQDRRGMTVLHWAAWSRKTPQRLYSTSQEKLGLSSHQIKDATGNSLLHYAVARGNLGLIETFFATPHASSMAVPNLAGMTLMHFAVESGNTGTIDYLLDRGFELHVTDNKGRTPLHQAAMRGNRKSFEHIMTRGAAKFLYCRDIEGNTAYDVARIFESKLVLEYLRSIGYSEPDDGKQGGTSPKRDEKASISTKALIIALIVMVTSLAISTYMRDRGVIFDIFKRYSYDKTLASGGRCKLQAI